MKNKHNAFFALARNDGALNLYLYDEIEGDSSDFWTGEIIESNTSANTIAKLIEDAGNVTEINVFINSYGGDVKEGLGIYSQLARSEAKVTAYIDGFACSIASVIAMAADKIVMNPTSLMMIHRAWTVAAGNAEELRKMADDLEVIDKSIEAAYMNKAGEKMDRDTLVELLAAETWLTADKCVEYGLCDEVSVVKADTSEADEALDEAKETAVDTALEEKLKAMFANMKKTPTNN